MVEPYAFIRTHREIATVQTSLESIAPVIKRGVIGYHLPLDDSQDDGTIEYLKFFCQQNPGYKLVYYPHKVYPANHPVYQNLTEINPAERLDSFYNAVLAELPQNEWLIKIDLDQIYHPAILATFLAKNYNPSLVLWFGRYNLHYDFESKQLYNVKNPAVSLEADQWLLYNQQLSFSFRVGVNEGKFYAWEYLDLDARLAQGEIKLAQYPIFTWHFPYLKPQRPVDPSQLVPYRPLKHPSLPELMTDEQTILKLCHYFKAPQKFQK